VLLVKRRKSQKGGTDMTFSMTAFRIIVASMLTCLGSGVFAQTWDKEPDAFMGIKFGKSLTAQVKRCPKNYFVIKSDDPARIICLSTTGMPGIFHNSIYLPNLGFPTALATTAVYLVGGNFEGMRFKYAHVYSDKMYELFQSRYGKPTRIRTATYQNLGGASFRGNIYTWEGKNVTIRVDEYVDGGSIEEGVVEVHTESYLKSVNDEEKKKAISGKDKL
jgi:hypothetical protein